MTELIFLDQLNVSIVIFDVAVYGVFLESPTLDIVVMKHDGLQVSNDAFFIF